MEKTIEFLNEHGGTIVAILTGLYELAVRIWPTNKNLSILDKVIKIISFIVPNKSTKKSYISTDGGEIKETSKHIIKMIAFFVLLSVGSYAQVNVTGKAFISFNSDSATVKSQVAAYNTSSYGNVGALYYNRQSSKWRIFSDSTWADLGTGSGSGGAFWPLGGTAATTSAVSITGTNDISIESDDMNLIGNGGVNILAGTEISNDGGGSTTTLNANRYETIVSGGGFINLYSSGTIAGQFIGNLPGTFTGGMYMRNTGIAFNTGTTGSGVQRLLINNSGQTTWTLGSDATGDMWYRNSSGFMTRLPAGSNGSLLRMGASSVPAYSTLTMPSTISANSIFVANAANTLVEITPTGSQSIRRNAGNTAWEAFTPASGISNSAAANEMAKSDGTNLVPSGVFSTVAGNLTFGTGLAGTSRSFTADGSGADVGLIFTPKGAGNIFLQPTSGGVAITNTGGSGTTMLQINPSSVSGSSFSFISGTNNPIFQGGGGTSFTIKANNAGAGGNTLILNGGSATSGNNNGGNLTLSAGLPSGSGSNGYILVQNLPTSCAGAPTGALANIAGVLNVCP